MCSLEPSHLKQSKVILHPTIGNEMSVFCQGYRDWGNVITGVTRNARSGTIALNESQKGDVLFLISAVLTAKICKR